MTPAINLLDCLTMPRPGHLCVLLQYVETGLKRYYSYVTGLARQAKITDKPANCYIIHRVHYRQVIIILLLGRIIRFFHG